MFAGRHVPPSFIPAAKHNTVTKAMVNKKNLALPDELQCLR